MTKALITGITGSGGSYLAEYLIKNTGWEIHGVSRWHSTSSRRNIQNIEKELFIHECDLTDFSATFRTLRQVCPNYIFHLAAHANVHVSFSNPIAVFQNNVNSTLNLFEAIRLAEIDTKVILISTSELYGIVTKEEIPIKESQPLNPVNIYAVSKLAQEKIGHSYFSSYKLPVVILRTFAYINPRRPDIFSSIFAKQVVDIEKGKRRKVVHGNLDSIRTLVDVRDIAEAYYEASQKCESGTPYNVGGNLIISVGEFLQLLKDKAKKEIISELDHKLLRPVDVTLQVPNTTLFEKTTGWSPKISLEDSVEFLLDFYRGNNE